MQDYEVSKHNFDEIKAAAQLVHPQLLNQKGSSARHRVSAEELVIQISTTPKLCID